MMLQDSWIAAESARQRLIAAGYHTSADAKWVHYWRQGVSGKIAIHPMGVDEHKVFRLEDRGS